MGMMNSTVDTAKSSGLITESKIISASKAILKDLLVYTDGTNNATVIIYNNASAAEGTVVAKIVVKGSDLMGGETQINCYANLGLYISISGTGATALVRYAD